MADTAPMSWEYIAAFFDGEGNINCGKLKNRGPYRETSRVFVLRFFQDYREVLDEIKEFLEKEGIQSSIKNYKLNQPNHHMLYITGSGNVVKTLLGMEKFLRVKREDAVEVLDWAYNLMEKALDGEFDGQRGRAKITYLKLQEVFAA